MQNDCKEDKDTAQLFWFTQTT